ncbi:hypothetical protein KI387_031474, partial [Taxus chinensis]
MKETMDDLEQRAPTDDMSFLQEVLTRSQRDLQQSLQQSLQHALRESQREMRDALTGCIMDLVKAFHGPNANRSNNQGAINNGEGSSSGQARTSINPPLQIFKSKFLQREEHPVELDPPSDMEDLKAC